MPENPESEGSRLITLKQIEQEHGVSRSALHTYRRSTSFPQPVPVEGSTKIQYRAREVAEWFRANPPQQGRRTDLATKHQQGDPVTTTTTDPRLVLMSALNAPPYDEVAGVRGTPLGEAAQLLDAYRASVVDEVVTALQAKARDLSAEAEEEMRRDLEDEAQVWHDAATAAGKLKRVKTEAQDG